MTRNLLLAMVFAFGIGAPAMAEDASYSCEVLIGLVGNVADTGLGIGGCYLTLLSSDGEIQAITGSEPCRIYSGTSSANSVEREVGDQVAAGEDLFAVCDLPVLLGAVTVVVGEPL
ncbi:MAG: hypothetical protein ACREQQ_18940 [Candidatus Binatia bacterium]